jgi:hypothetical protein
VSEEQNIYYRTLHNARQKGMSEHDAKRAAYIASLAARKPKTQKRRKK